MLTGLFRKALICHLRKIHARLNQHFFYHMEQERLRPAYIPRKQLPNPLVNKR
jgi:cytochrome c oxidase subunit IV